jgi:hypothetical protein
LSMQLRRNLDTGLVMARHIVRRRRCWSRGEVLMEHLTIICLAYYTQYVR